MHINENLDPEKKENESVASVDAEVVQEPTADSNKEPKTIDPETQKYLIVKPVSLEFKTKLNKVIADLDAIREDIFKKKNEIVAKRQMIKDKVTFLNDLKKVKVDKGELERTEGQIEKYLHLLDGVIYELSHEIAYYTLFASDEKPPVEKIVVSIKAPDELETYLEIQSSGIKRYLKNIKRDISISFSRYIFGFDEQIKHLTFIESYIKSREAEEKALKAVKHENSDK